jgi:hypothetical protein
LQYIGVEFTPSIFLLYALSPHSWNSFNRSHFSVYIRMYTILAQYSPFYLFSPHPPHPTSTNPPRQDLFCPPVLHFFLSDIFDCLR